MFNDKVILVIGFSRGGTNILWNILQSHPKVCAPKYKLGSILSYSKNLKFGRFYFRLKKYGLAYSFLSKKIVDYQLYKYKLENLNDQNNKYKSEVDLYSKNEVSNSALCLKSVDGDVYLTNELLDIYPDMHIIFLLRNGYAIANGHKRRGRNINKTAELYCEIGKKMDELSGKTPNTISIKFEDILSDPFLISEQLYRFTSIKPEKLTKLRLKSKKILHQDNSHDVKHGEEDHKYWFSKEEIKHFIDPGINNKQIAELSRPEIYIFTSIASEQLRSFGYENNLIQFEIKDIKIFFKSIKLYCN